MSVDRKSFGRLFHTEAVAMVPLSAAQKSYVHIMGHVTFVFCDFLENRFPGHRTFVLSTIEFALRGNISRGQLTDYRTIA